MAYYHIIIPTLFLTNKTYMFIPTYLNIHGNINPYSTPGRRSFKLLSGQNPRVKISTSACIHFIHLCQITFQSKDITLIRLFLQFCFNQTFIFLYFFHSWIILLLHLFSSRSPSARSALNLMWTDKYICFKNRNRSSINESGVCLLVALLVWSS